MQQKIDGSLFHGTLEIYLGAKKKNDSIETKNRKKRELVRFTNRESTLKEQNLDKCDVILVYRGSKHFEDTWPITMDEFNSMCDNLGRIQAIIDEKDLTKNVSAMHRKRSKEYRRKVDKIESSEESELDLEDLLEGVPPAKKPKKQRKTRGTLDLSKKPVTRSCSGNMQTAGKKDDLSSQPGAMDNNVQKQLPANFQDGNNMQKQEKRMIFHLDLVPRTIMCRNCHQQTYRTVIICRNAL